MLLSPTFWMDHRHFKTQIVLFPEKVQPLVKTLVSLSRGSDHLPLKSALPVTDAVVGALSFLQKRHFQPLEFHSFKKSVSF